jgi:hypothetical protein
MGDWWNPFDDEKGHGFNGGWGTGALAGAGTGLLLGGPIGAAIGGVAGGVYGAATGDFASPDAPSSSAPTNAAKDASTPYYDPQGVPTGEIGYAAGDLDMSAPGAAETNYGDGSKFGQGGYGDAMMNDPGFMGALGQSPSSDYWNGVAGKYQSGGPGVSNRAEEAYQQFQGTQPANMSPYYDRQVQTGTNDINRQLASRGMYGSTVGMNQLGNSIGGIRAQQAKDEAGYQLQRGQLAGTLGAGADLSSRGQAQSQLDWTKGLGDLAHTADADQLARQAQIADIGKNADTYHTNMLGLGNDAAKNAEQLRHDRIFGTEDRLFNEDTANAAADTSVGTAAIDAYQQILAQIIAAQTGGATADANNKASNDSTLGDWIKTGVSAYAASRGGGRTG